jgi:menaquinone-9 beta-reductase
VGELSAPPTVEEAEVVIVGAGPAGAVAGATLAELGRDVLLVDQSEFPRDKPCGDGLTHSAVEVLEELGLGSLAERGAPVEDCRIVIAHGAEMKGWYRPPSRLPQSRLMRTIPRKVMDQALLDAALERGARFLRARVDRPVLESGEARGVVLTNDDGGGSIAARCVIAADGATSRLRRTSGFADDGDGHQVYALRQYITTEERLDPVFDVYVPLAYDGGLLAGYGWVFPSGERRANVGVAYYTPAVGRPRARIREVLSSFVRELQEREGERFGRLSEPTKPIGAPIAVRFSARRCQSGSLLFSGEAAHTADPLTGEGISFSMRSGQIAARAADEYLRTGAVPDLGRSLGRRFPRLGQDLSLLARIAGSAGDGFNLAEREHQAFVLAVRRVTGSAPDDPGLGDTDVRRLLSVDPASVDALDRVNDRLLDTLRTSFPFGLETLHRDVRARGGPLAAACALAAARAHGDLDEAAIAVAEAAELVAVADRCLPRMSSRAESDLAWLNNAMAMLLGDLALTGALRAPQRDRALCVKQIGAAIRRISDGQLIDAKDRYDVERTPDRCMEAIEARAGSLLSLAASLGATMARETHGVDTFGAFGRNLGIAHQLSEDVRELTFGDELTRRRPGSDLREGLYSLPVVTALEADPELASALGGPVSGKAVPSIVARVREVGALQEAAHRCRSHVGWALDSASRFPGEAGELLTALSNYPLVRLNAGVAEREARVGALG